MKPIKTLLLIFLAVFLLWLSCLVVTFYAAETWEIRGQIGDTFGSINAMFSGLAFSGLLYTLLLQREELALQREELKLQRDEMKASNTALIEQAIAQKQQFEAAVAELKVRALEAEIEALKLESQQYTPGYAATQYAPKLFTLAGQINGISESLKNG